MNRRNAILQAARREFAAQGYAGARVERIASAASVNKQLIFHYFGTKDGLYTAAVDVELADAPKALDRTSSPTEALRRCVANLAVWLLRSPGAALAIAECGRDRSTPIPAQRQVAGFLAAQADAVGALVDDGQRQGHFRDDLDKQAIVELAISSAVGRALSAADPDQDVRPDRGFPALLAQVVVEHCAWR